MNNLTLDVLIGLVLIYLVFSVFVSVFTEYFLNGLGGFRSKNLRMAISSALGATSRKDRSAEPLVRLFMEQGIVLSLYDRRKDESAPSAIPEDVFAKGFIASVLRALNKNERPATPGEFVSLCDGLDAAVYSSKERVIQTVRTLVTGHEADWPGFEKEIAAWFAEVAERSGGWYKRRIEGWKLTIAFLLAALLNIDTLFIYRVLSIDSRSRQELVTTAADLKVSRNEMTPKEANLAAPAPARDASLEARLAVDQGLATTLGKLRNTLIDNDSFRKHIHSRCWGSLAGSGESSKISQCDADLLRWYPEIQALRQGFGRAFDALECENDPRCAKADLPGGSPDAAGSVVANKGGTSRAITPVLNEIADRAKVTRGNNGGLPDIRGLENLVYSQAVTNLATRLEKLKTLDVKGLSECKLPPESNNLNNLQSTLKGIEAEVDLFKRVRDQADVPVGRKAYWGEWLSDSWGRLDDVYGKIIDAAKPAKNLDACSPLRKGREVVAQHDLDPLKRQFADLKVIAGMMNADGIGDGCEASALSDGGAHRLRACVVKLFEIRNNLTQVMGVPAKSKSDRQPDPQIKEMVDAISSSLDKARAAAEARIVGAVQASSRYCRHVGEDELKGATAGTREVIAKVNMARSECVELFKRLQAGELGLPLGWDADLNDVRKRLNDPKGLETPWYCYGWAFLGFVLSALALSLGSKFWFDALGKLMSIRLAGAARAAVNETRRDEPGQAPAAPGPTGGGTPAKGTGVPYFADALSEAEGRLRAQEVVGLQQAMGMTPPYSGQLDQPTRLAIGAWFQKRGGPDAGLWALEERHIDELLARQAAPLAPSERLGIGSAAAPLPALVEGSQGTNVERFKSALGSINGPDEKPLLAAALIDGNFDAETRRATEDFQANRGLTRDGVVGPATWLKLTSNVDLLPPELLQPVWMAHAIHEIGQAELPGRAASNPRIEAYQAKTGGGGNDDIAWCSSFVCWVLDQAGVDVTGVTATASSWCTWGEPDPGNAYGSVIVVKRKGVTVAPGGPGAHVGFLVQSLNGRYFILGGNQGKPGAVTVSAFPEGEYDLLAVRKPSSGQAADPTDPASGGIGAPDQAGPTGGGPLPPGRPLLQRGCRDRSAVAQLQTLLNSAQIRRPFLPSAPFVPAPLPLVIDGLFGPKTEIWVREFQSRYLTPGKSSGVVDAATWAGLESWNSPPAGYIQPPIPTTEEFGRDLPKGLTSAHINAVCEVESGRRGLLPLPSRKCVILFEGHQFYRLLKSAGVPEARLQAELSNVLYERWTRNYYVGGEGEWERLEKARSLATRLCAGMTLPPGALNPGDIADMAASWGLFQIMGFNFASCGSADVAAFVASNNTEAEQKALFVQYLRNNTRLVQMLIAEDWAGFARLYNGQEFRKHGYDLKLKQAYDRYR